MPRRKKKGVPMPPLEFVHSPLYQNAPSVSYDFGDSNTATARTVGVDELDTFPWVSPQFKNKMTTQTCRTRKSTRSKAFTRLRSKSENSPMAGFCEIRCKFPPLTFVQISPSPSDDGCMRKEITSQQLESNSGHCQQNVLVGIENTSSHTANHSDQTKDSPRIEHFAIFQEDFPHIQTPHVKETSGEQQIFHSSDSLLFVRDNNNTNIQMDSSSKTLECDEEKKDLQDEYERSLLVKTCSKRGISVTRNNSFPPLAPSSLLPLSSTPIESEAERNCPPLYNRLNQCSPPHLPSHVEVLVTDTPECYYGMSMRQRQLNNV